MVVEGNDGFVGLDGVVVDDSSVLRVNLGGGVTIEDEFRECNLALA